MIKEDKVLVSINLKNLTYYRNLGYNIENFNISKKFEMVVSVMHIPKKSHTKVTAICEICSSENIISIQKYYVNYERNSKNYYSCFGCKNIEKEKTCLVKYGVKSYSQTDEYRTNESIKWKGIQKGSEKGRETMQERYGVDSYFKTDIMRKKNKIWMSSDEFKSKSKSTLIEKYGVDSFSKTRHFKDIIESKKEIIKEKMRVTFLEKYGSEYYSRTKEFRINYRNKIDQIRDLCKETCLSRYGVDNVSKVEEIMGRIMDTKAKNNLIIDKKLISDWELYKLEVRKITNGNKKTLYESWDGVDYYDNELIIGNFCYNPTNRLYPTIDHKISTFFGFCNNIPTIEIADISNLCITKRFINSTKGSIIEAEFQI